MSVTGRNLRHILLQTSIFHIRKLKSRDITAKYRDIPRGEEYRVNVIKEIIDIKNQQLEVAGFDDHELDEILRFVCVS